MHSIALTSALLSTALLTCAAPTLNSRACSVAYPRSIGFPINYSISQEAGGLNPHPNALGFDNIPSGSYGCQLEANFPANYPITSSGSSQLNIFATGDGADTLFGTVTLQSSPVAPTRFVVNSAVCKSSMQFRLEIASETEAGSVAFADTKDAGFTMTYNC
ncbi:hypothetical protein EK21DRAFT_113268 [Setomelanomma holmii]|uniref:Ubiquitin 3 binding protein But2 C-terminal domain-containing protein n=1 Tax=Setomelanomma holmii TaxID=210430 RepID=A0A9P4H8K0_9PLEO|nr:hypothetical protein EK21DRAFT_113268 [Setomelanomma holmii]